MNNITLTGNLTKEPQQYQGTGDPFCKFTIANNDYKDHPIFIDCFASGRLCEPCLTYLNKGSKVLVQGKLSVKETDKDGKHYKNVEIRCDTVEFLTQKSDIEQTKPEEKPKTSIPFAKPIRNPEPKKEETKVIEDDLPF